MLGPHYEELWSSKHVRHEVISRLAPLSILAFRHDMRVDLAAKLIGGARKE